MVSASPLRAKLTSPLLRPMFHGTVTMITNNFHGMASIMARQRPSGSSVNGLSVIRELLSRFSACVQGAAGGAARA